MKVAILSVSLSLSISRTYNIIILYINKYCIQHTSYPSTFLALVDTEHGQKRPSVQDRLPPNPQTKSQISSIPTHSFSQPSSHIIIPKPTSTHQYLPTRLPSSFGWFISPCQKRTGTAHPIVLYCTVPTWRANIFPKRKKHTKRRTLQLFRISFDQPSSTCVRLNNTQTNNPLLKWGHRITIQCHKGIRKWPILGPKRNLWASNTILYTEFCLRSTFHLLFSLWCH
jgi:hypothetical protein